jgi:uncharacterized protein (TIGR02996 family)
LSDEEAFLRAIADAPDDNAPRLVYADWLDEHNQPQRAEYARLASRRHVQGALERLREIAPYMDPIWTSRVRPGDPRLHHCVILQEVSRGAIASVFEATTAFERLRGWRCVSCAIVETPSIS